MNHAALCILPALALCGGLWSSPAEAEALGPGVGVAAATGSNVTAGLAGGFGFGVANYVVGKLVDSWGVLE